jgi:histidinol-phosphate aminotransferase
MSSNIIPRKVLERIKPYSPGKPIWELQEEMNLDHVIKLASNENPFGPSAKGIAAISAELEELNRYPDADTVDLKAAIADKLNVQTNQLIVTNGADELITLISSTYLDEGDEIIVPYPSFSEYDFGADLMGATIVPVKFDEGFQFNIDKIIDALTEQTKLLYICSPNNPTGTYLPKEQFEQLLNAVPDHVLVILDGAYSHYAEAEDYTDGLEFVKAGKNVLVMQTFSKVYGLAGLRVGYGIAPAHITQTILKVKEPFNVNSLGQAAAAAAIHDDEHVFMSKKKNKEGAQMLYDAFEELNLNYTETQSNFILVQLGPDAEQLYEQLLQKGVILRYGNTWGLPEYVRVTIGTKEENEFFIKQLKSVLLSE